MRRLVMIAGIAALTLAGCAGAGAEVEVPEAAGGPPFEAALEACSLREVPNARLGDEGETFIINGAGDESGGLSFDVTTCLLDALGMPDSVDAQMGSTRALDGTQTATWDDITASWTYHPDAGLDIVLTYTPTE